MDGGRIKVDGNVGDFAGCEMHGGLIQVAGNAGNRIAAAYPGSKKGMTDGTILIGGDVGSEVGASMRRGTVVVGGSCNDGLGFNMIAGSILVFGSCGARPGAGMRRGTIGLFGSEPTTLLPTFRAAGRFRPLFLRLLFRELANQAFPVDRALLDAELLLSHGDLVALGKGEVWSRTN
jgi:formylmethanofuran dehydrogenase subunit C